ncbi:hypothetical protein J2X31_002584 [Flavobacterium arsenatis]|uniref:DUF6705 domain-containing protein n=1 Tax=Flavobacterium arsenatis TaxID=1484332 RepID=A0ABU1TRR0_9FLAO|nr:DUF6705 family protein [Flavobacterium arsenatis]MDR6968561.1 hypothetical protein [Flavobacterium arsenatis]
MLNINDIIPKAIVTIVFLFTISMQAQFPILRTVSYSQTRLVNYSYQNGDYIKDTSDQLNSYIGTWKYFGTNKILTLKLVRINQFFSKIIPTSSYYYYIDQIVLTYKLEDNNGNIIFDNTNITPTNQFVIGNGIGSYLSGKEDANYINGIFQDFTTNVLVSRCEISKVATATGQPEKIFFKLFKNHSSYMSTPSNYQPGVTPFFSVPNNIELIKQ